MKQTDLLLDYMKKKGGITPKQAMNDLGIYRLASRIYDLKSLGYVIVKTTETVESRYGSARVSRYTLGVTNG